MKVGIKKLEILTTQQWKPHD